MMNESLHVPTCPAEPSRARWVAPSVEVLGALADLTLEFGSQGGGECDPDTGIGCGP